MSTASAGCGGALFIRYSRLLLLVATAAAVVVAAAAAAVVVVVAAAAAADAPLLFVSNLGFGPDDDPLTP